MDTLLGIILGLLIAVLVVVSSRRYNIAEKTTQKTDKLFSPQAKIIETKDDIEKEMDKLGL
jgi:hypothetical protein